MNFDLASVWALAATLAPIALCVAMGVAVGNGRARWPGSDMFVGFGIMICAISMLAIATRLPLSSLMLAAGAVAVMVPLLRRELPGGAVTWIAIALFSPVLAIAARHPPAMWDDFWNWLPNAAYAYHHNSLAWPDLPPSLSIFPGYPQGMPLAIAAASFMSGGFAAVAGPIVNVLLLAGSCAVFADALTTILVRHGRLRQGSETSLLKPPLVVIALAVAVTTLLNPGLDGAVLLSSYADTGTMAAVGALALIGTEILTRVLAGDTKDLASLAWRFGLVAAMLVSLKQSNPALLALLTGGLIAVALRHPALRKPTLLPLLARMVAPALVFIVVWRFYVRSYLHNMPNSEQAFRPLADWNFGLLPNTLISIGDLIADWPVFHGLMWSVSVAGLLFIFQLPRRVSEARILAIVGAGLWIGYNGFMLFIYLAVMSENDATIAADYWRYMPHAVLPALYALTIALAVAFWPVRFDLRHPAAALAAAALALAVLPLRADINDPAGRDWQTFIRETATEMQAMIPTGAHVLIVPASPSSPYAVALRYHLWGLGGPAHPVKPVIVWDEKDFPDITRRAQRREADYLVVQDAESSMDTATDVLGLPRLNGELVLFGWQGNRWIALKSWPVPTRLVHPDRLKQRDAVASATHEPCCRCGVGSVADVPSDVASCR
jgi:hypothetical protein